MCWWFWWSRLSTSRLCRVEVVRTLYRSKCLGFPQRRGSQSLHQLQAPMRHSCLSCSASRQARNLAVSRPDETESALLDLVDDKLRPAQRPHHPKRLACASVFDCNNLAVNATPRCHPKDSKGASESHPLVPTLLLPCAPHFGSEGTRKTTHMKAFDFQAVCIRRLCK